MFHPMRLVIIFLSIANSICNPASLYDDSPFVEEIHPRDLYEIIRDQTSGVWIIQFYNKAHDEIDTIAGNYSIAAKSMIGYVKLAAINMQHHPFMRYVLDVKHNPTYAIYGYYKHFPDFINEVVTVDELHEEASRELVRYFEERSVYRFVQNRYNLEMGPADFDYKLRKSEKPWFIAYYNRQHEKCAALTAVWQRLVADFHEVINFGTLNNPLYRAMNIPEETYPLIQYFAIGSQVDPPINYTAEPYVYETMRDYLHETLPLRNIYHITNFEIAKRCLEYRFCIIAFLPQIDLNEKLVKDSMSILRSECRKYRERAWMWMWTLYDDQPDIEDALGVKSDIAKYGTLIVFNVKGNVYARNELDAPLTVESLNQTLEQIDNDRGFDFNIIATSLPRIQDFSQSISYIDMHDEL